MTHDEARVFAYARAFAEVGRSLALEENRTAALTERVATIEADIETIQTYVSYLVTRDKRS